MTLTTEQVSIIDMLLLVVFLVITGAMMMAMAVHAFSRHGQPLQFIGRIDWKARMAWASSFFMFGVWLGAFVRVGDMYRDGHDASAILLVSDVFLVSMALLLYVTWRAWSRVS